jgi:hypothetical protein
VEIYRTKVYFQPLPLFSLQGLREKLQLSSQFLRWSFLALCLHYTDCTFYGGRKAQALEFYADASREMVMSLAAEGVTTTEVEQTLCLLILGDIMGT